MQKGMLLGELEGGCFGPLPLVVMQTKQAFPKQDFSNLLPLSPQEEAQRKLDIPWDQLTAKQ
jgi:hypothetical protein